MKEIGEVLHIENIMRVIKSSIATVPGGIIDEMLRPTDKTIGDSGYYFKIENTRRVAQQVMFGAASKAAKFKGISKIPIKLIHSFEHFNHEVVTLQNLLSEDEGRQKLGIELFGHKIAEFTQTYVNLRRAALYSMLSTGHIYIDNEGDLVMDSAKAIIDVDYGVPAGNKNQLDVLGDGDIIAAKWSNTATDIATQIADLQKAALTKTGYKVKLALYGKNVPGYIAGNTVMKEFLRMSPVSAKMVASGGIPMDFLDLEWRPYYAANFEDHLGTTHFFCGDNDVVFLPDIMDRGWWGLIEGSFPCPSDVRAFSDGIEALKSMVETWGMFGYATVCVDPPSVRQYAGDTMLPVLCVANAIFQGVVHW